MNIYVCNEKTFKRNCSGFLEKDGNQSSFYFFVHIPTCCISCPFIYGKITVHSRIEDAATKLELGMPWI
jgi:hypothetical protein